MVTRAKSRIESNGAAPPTAADESLQIVIPRIQPKVVEITIEGITPLLVSCWSEKAKAMMLEKQMKKATRGREAKDPQQCYHDSRYISVEGWDGIPAGGVKGCLVNACRGTDIPMTVGKRMVFVRAQGTTAKGQGLVRIYGEHEMNEATVRLETGVADLRYRAMYRKWTANLEIEFLANMISAEQVCNLVELAGFIEGLAEHRPGAPKNHTGDLGRFRIKRSEA